MSLIESSPAAPQAKLSLWDATSIIVGIIVGASIYESTPRIAGCAPNMAWLVAIWTFGAVLMIVGALCYAELASACPRHGGDYIYLTEAFGRKLGFVFAWMQFWVVRPGSIGAIAYVFARYSNELVPIAERWHGLMIYAVLSIVVLTGVNLLGLNFGKNVQNIITALKYLGLAAVVIVGLCCTQTVAPTTDTSLKNAALDLSTAMIFILFAYSGWNEIAYVATEVHSPHKNVLRALMLGSFFVAAIYLLAAFSFVHALGIDGVRHSRAVASDVLQLALGSLGGNAISILICITALGGVNGMLFTGARIYYAMGNDHRLYSWLGRWDARRHAPLRTLFIQAAVTVALVVGFGLGNNSFEKLVVFTGPAFWFFLFLVGVSVVLLRWRHPERNWLLPMPLSALLAVIFCLSSAYMIYASTSYALSQPRHDQMLFWSVNGGVLLLGIALSFVK